MLRYSLSFAALCCAGPLFAQKTSVNVVTASDDAFGRSVGGERIGIYSPEDVRGFNPIDAGNARIEGLYFDQLSLPNNRLIDSSTIRVGYAAQAFPFPSPTGIVSHQLEKADGQALTSIEVETDQDGNIYGIVQSKIPLAGEKFGLSVGIGGRRSRIPAARFVNFYGGAINATWRPYDKAEINVFTSGFRSAKVGGHPILYPAGVALPPRIERQDYIGQPWSHGTSNNFTHGATARLPLGKWRLEAGIFSSIKDDPKNFANLALGVTPDGRVANQRIVADQDQYAGSTSGEVRMVRVFPGEKVQHRLTLMARGRRQRRDYGGQASFSLGATSLFNRVIVPEPNFVFGPKNRSTVRQWTAGAAYELANTKGLKLGASIQKTDYRKRSDFADPLRTDAETRDKPWLFSANATLPLGAGVSLYGGYVRGLEESPVAPDIAINNSEAPPAVRTRQYDFGLRYAVTSHLTLITGAFEVKKPYFNLDSARRYGILGSITNRGAEVSLAGRLAKGLTLVAGSLFLDPRLSGPEITAGRIGVRPVGSFRRKSILNLDWRLAKGQSPFSIDLSFDSVSGFMGNAANTLQTQPREILNMGTRYRFKLAGSDWLARLAVTNIFNNYSWRATSSGGFLFNPSRAATLSLTVDL